MKNIQVNSTGTSDSGVKVFHIHFMELGTKNILVTFKKVLFP